jgi:hypothetical protein
MFPDIDGAEYAVGDRRLQVRNSSSEMQEDPTYIEKPPPPTC